MSFEALLKLTATRPRALERGAHGAVRPTVAGASWYRIEAKAKQDDAADVWIYEAIGGWDLTAADFARDLRGIKNDRINVHLNSPGGDVFDGVAIMNALRSHDAHITVTVDALAASIASVIAMGGNKIIMGRNSQMMIHDAWGLAIGNADEMRETAKLLDMISDNIASVYSDRAGGEPSAWRKVMKGECWYSAQEAVDAGLADEVAPLPEREAEEAEKAAAKWDLSIFNYRSRSAAPEPVIVPALEDGEDPPEPGPPRLNSVPAGLGDLIRSGIKPVPKPVSVDLAGFKAAVGLALNNLPSFDPKPVETPEPEPKPIFDRATFDRAMKGARL